jgi:hypothetical protein
MRVRELHPELGYIGTPSFARGFLVFVVCGLIAGVSALTMFKAEPDPDPMSAMALAPPEAQSNTARPTSLDSEIGKSISVNGEARETPTSGAIKSRCEKSATDLAGDCVAGQIRRARSILALNERPAIAAAPIGHRVDPAVLPPEPAAPALAVPRKDADAPVRAEMPAVATLIEDAESATPAETPYVGPTSPGSLRAVIAEKPRGRGGRTQRHEREYREPTPRYRHEHREYASTPRYYGNRQAYQAAGYARLW